MNLFALPTTEEDALGLLQERGVIAKRRLCSSGHEMCLQKGSRMRWRCKKRGCGEEVGLRVGNWLEGIRLPLLTVVRFLYGWAWEYTSVAWCERELGINHSTVVSLNGILRETCSCSLLGQGVAKIGGEGCIVEVDETLFTRRKANAGRILPEQWVLGGICRETGECFLACVHDRCATTLLTVIEERVQKGSDVYTDCWRGYSTAQLGEAGFNHFTVNPSINFVDPSTGVHTQNIERL